MRLIILNQFFYPDHSATSQLMTDLAESLVKQGVEVTAVSGRGRYNGGATLPARTEYAGVRIRRAWATSCGKGSVLGRLTDYCTFYFGAALKLFSLPRHDLVMALTTPPLIGLLALAVCRLRRMRLVALVQDIYPDLGVVLGTFKRGSLTTRTLDWLNRLVLRQADRVIVLGDCMREVVAAKLGAGAEERIDVIHNWADGAQISPLEAKEQNPFSATHQLGERFVVLFSGNFGRVNDFATPLAAARLLKDRPDILFLFIGDGAKAGEIKEFSRTHELKNVRLLPYQARTLLRFSLAAGHAHLVTLASGLAGMSVPSKTYGSLAAGRAILFVGDAQSSIARLINEHGCGAALATGESERLAQIIAAWADDRALVERLGLAARQLFELRFDRAHAVSAYMESFAKCLTDAPRRSQRKENVVAVKEG
jgi:colanic acid biosynthesis glycosyl transferase WcaI